ncbi:MAG: hypothetical protein APF81_08835 [Desulfosporosinus sp. BRH_c37]|nr:MAG: hypothetical protein APF81_08835 [Desulfosporosinus sp. BRH_c37]
MRTVVGNDVRGWALQTNNTHQLARLLYHGSYQTLRGGKIPRCLGGLGDRNKIYPIEWTAWVLKILYFGQVDF